MMLANMLANVAANEDILQHILGLSGLQILLITIIIVIIHNGYI